MPSWVMAIPPFARIPLLAGLPEMGGFLTNPALEAASGAEFSSQFPELHSKSRLQWALAFALRFSGGCASGRPMPRTSTRLSGYPTHIPDAAGSFRV